MAFIDNKGIVAYFTEQDLKPYYQELYKAKYDILKEADFMRAMNDDAFKVYQFSTVAIFVEDEKKRTLIKSNY